MGRMTTPSQATPHQPPRAAKYARVECERRFLLAGPPPASGRAPAGPAGSRRIADRYLTGTRLRLRCVSRPDGGSVAYKLTQKLPAGRPGPVQGLITNLYLSRAEYDLLAGLPAAVLSKTRLSRPPLGVDVFDPPLHGLVLAEAEFDTEAEARSFTPPGYAVAEVTDDPRFTGGRLVRASRPELLGWLAEFGIDAERPAGRPPATGR